ncbi:orotidine-5'-phosphate decarboxylase [candidate division WOR-3 bacterium]|nr:orotidine-5'-phosphate decarboxylase [candidate division WOR-3 bacterium]
MKFIKKLEKITAKNNSLLCVGLDTDINLIPKFLLKEANPMFAFNRELIDATKSLVCAYKLNSAFYEAQGKSGFETLKQTKDYIPSDIPVIIDAKRGDIGNSSKMYARTFFENFGFDGTTVNPYMGFDSVEPFLKYEDKCTFILCLTSNPGSSDFQTIKLCRPFRNQRLYEEVVRKVLVWNKKGNCGLVVGATKPEELKKIRKIAQDLPILIPGIGAQGGKIESVVKYGGNNIIINSSRSIIYASSDQDFTKKAEETATKLRDEINRYRKNI